MILCVGLSPTIQRTLRFRGFAPGRVNRAAEVWVTASGKAVNVARVVHLLGGRSHLVQPVSGDSGRALTVALDMQGITHTSVTTDGDSPTRTCTTILSGGLSPTELVEEAPPLSEGDIARLREAILTALPHARALCLSGSFPTSIDDSFYADLVRAANRLGVAAFVDAQKGPLREALGAQPFLVKPNLEEATATLSMERSGNDEADGRTAIAALRAAGARWAVVSLGSGGSLLGGPEGEVWQVESPEVAAVNAIGAGDSLMAGILYAHIEHGSDIPAAVVYGTACAAANCLTPTSGVVRPDDVAALLPQVRITGLPAL
jgi:tagatose 6-phosphate kinase